VGLEGHISKLARETLLRLNRETVSGQLLGVLFVGVQNS